MKDKVIMDRRYSYFLAALLAKLKEDMAPYALQQVLGHKSIETTMAIYTHIGKGYLGDEARKLRAKKSGLHSVRKLHLVKG